jgi:uncharacterized protein (TIGR00369 family)
MTASDFTSPQVIEQHRLGVREHFRTFPFFKLLGIELVEIEPGRSKLSLMWRPDLLQPAGILHGGVIAALADTSIAHSILLTPQYLEAKAKGVQMASVDLRTRYLRPVSAGRVECEARVIRMGRQIIHADARVTAEDGKDVALCESIYMLLSREQLQKRSG